MLHIRKNSGEAAPPRRRIESGKCAAAAAAAALKERANSARTRFPRFHARVSASVIVVRYTHESGTLYTRGMYEMRP